METRKTMTVDVSAAEIAQMPEKAKAQEQFKIPSPENKKDFVPANLMSGPASEELTRIFEQGSMYHLEGMYGAMQEISNEKDFEKFLELLRYEVPGDHKNYVIFRRRSGGGAECAFKSPDGFGPYFRCSYKPGIRSQDGRMTIDYWVNGNVVRMRVKPSKSSNENGNSFTPQMLSVLRYDDEQGKYVSALPDIHTDMKLNPEVVGSMLNQVNENMGRTSHALWNLTPTAMKDRRSVKEKVRQRTMDAVGG